VSLFLLDHGNLLVNLILLPMVMTWLQTGTLELVSFPLFLDH